MLPYPASDRKYQASDDATARLFAAEAWDRAGEPDYARRLRERAAWFRWIQLESAKLRREMGQR